MKTSTELPREKCSDKVRLRIDLAYDGTDFHGWARQKPQDGQELRTVQGVVEDALSLVLRAPLQLTVAGRTDAGVHAMHQVAHFDMNKIPKRGASEIAFALNAYLRKTSHKITILNSNKTEDNFSARFDAKKRVYVYVMKKKEEMVSLLPL